MNLFELHSDSFIQILLTVLSYLVAVVGGRMSWFLTPSTRRKAEILFIAAFMDFFGFWKLYKSRSTFHKKELERLNNNPGGIEANGWLRELDREYHKLYFRSLPTNDDNFVYIEINRKPSPPK